MLGQINARGILASSKPFARIVRRSKLLPEGGGDVNLNEIVARLHAAVEAAKSRGLIERDAAARKLWRTNTAELRKAVTVCAAHFAAGPKPTC
jgi:hypothetical protein